MVIKTCNSCGNIFIGRKESKYCCKGCADTHLKNGHLKTCKMCGNVFYRPKSQLENAEFCSSECYRNRKSLTGISIICKNCNNEFYTTPSQIKRGRGIYCSIKCRDEYRSKYYRGSIHHAWKGGISFEPYCLKFNYRFKERVREFFGRKCVECGKYESVNKYETTTEKRKCGIKLHVHHVNYNKYACCDTSKPLFVTLCHSCHSKTNSKRRNYEKLYTDLIINKYGGKCYFTEEEYNEYKMSRRNKKGK